MATEAELASPRRDAGAPVLHAVDVSVRFGGVVALHDVSVEVRAGEVLGLIGPNGAGKTTLFDVLSGLRAPSSGRVVYGGRDITRRGPTWRSRQGIRRTFQRQQMFGWLTVEENVLVARGVARRRGRAARRPGRVTDPTTARAARRARSDEVLELCGLTRCVHNRQGSCPSGGRAWSRWRARSSTSPRCCCWTSRRRGSKRPRPRASARRMQRVCRERDCAVVLVEHDVGFVMQHCDRIVVLNLGEVIASGTPDEIRGNAAVQEAYLGESKP